MSSHSDAWEKLEEAVDEFLRIVDGPGILTDWVFCTQRIVALDDGEGSQTSWIGAQGQPMYRTLGLLKYVQTLVEQEIEKEVADGDDDL